MINDNIKANFKRLLKRNGLYFASGLVLLAIAIAGITATGTKTPEVRENTTSRFESIIIPEVTTRQSTGNSVEINIDEFTTLPSDEPSTAAVFDNNAPTLEETTEAKTVIFYSPLSLSVTKDYSMGVPVFSQTMNDYRTHNGVDFAGIRGENVKTTGEGTVISVTKDAIWGNTVTIDHHNGITSSVSGLADEALISTGTEVYTGTIIGTVGEIPVESADNPHVHLEMRVNGQLVDPLEILGLSGEE